MLTEHDRKMMAHWNEHTINLALQDVRDGRFYGDEVTEILELCLSLSNHIRALEAVQPTGHDGGYDVWETRRVYPPYEWTLLTSLGTKQAADDFVLSRMTNNCLDRRMVFYRILPAGSPPPEADAS